MLHEAVKSDFPDCCLQKCDIAGELPVASMSRLKVLLLVRLFPAANVREHELTLPWQNSNQVSGTLEGPLLVPPSVLRTLDLSKTQ